MEKDLFLLVLALIVSAVFGINLLLVIAVVDIADRLIHYHDFKEIVMHGAPSLEERFSCACVLVTPCSVFIHIDAKKTKKKMPIQLSQAGWAAAVTQLNKLFKEQPHRL